MTHVGAASAAMMAVYGSTHCAHPTRTARAPRDGEPTLKVMTYNVKTLEPVEVNVLDAGRSDHLPVIATFERAGRD